MDATSNFLCTFQEFNCFKVFTGSSNINCDICYWLYNCGNVCHARVFSLINFKSFIIFFLNIRKKLKLGCII